MLRALPRLMVLLVGSRLEKILNWNRERKRITYLHLVPCSGSCWSPLQGLGWILLKLPKTKERYVHNKGACVCWTSHLMASGQVPPKYLSNPFSQQANTPCELQCSKQVLLLEQEAKGESHLGCTGMDPGSMHLLWHKEELIGVRTQRKYVYSSVRPLVGMTSYSVS